MPADEYHIAIQKATVYDPEKIIERDPKDSFTKDDIKALMDAYIEGIR